MRKPALLVPIFALLALFFGWETWQASRSSIPERSNAATVAAGTWQPGVPVPDPPPPPDTASAVAAIVARPLFRADRQPYREAVGPVAPVRNYEAELSRFSLLGILAIGDRPMGIVVGKSGSQAERWELVAGDSLPGFSVKEVRMDGLMVTADDKEFLLPLYAGPPIAAKGGPVRTEVTRKEPAQPAAAPAASPGQQKPASPAQTAPPRPAPAQAIQPAPAPSGIPVYPPRRRK